MGNYGFSPRAYGRRLAGYAGQSGRNYFETQKFLRPQSSDRPSRLIGPTNRLRADFHFVRSGRQCDLNTWRALSRGKK